MLRADLLVADGEEPIDIDRLALQSPLDHPHSVGIVLVGILTPVIADALYPVLLVPHDVAPGAIMVIRPPGLVAVGVVSKGAVVYVGRGVWVRAGVGVSEVVGGLVLRHRLA